MKVIRDLMHRSLLSSSNPDPAPRARLVLESDPARPVYAVGDVHGSIDALREMDRSIERDMTAFDQPALVIMLGDYVDRGPFSAQVVDHLMRKRPFERIALAGNHELMLLDYLRGAIPFSRWAEHGGAATCRSFGVEPSDLGSAERRTALRTAIGPERLAYLKGLPTLARMGELVFVHAGLRPGVALDEQHDRDLTGIRETFYEASGRQPFWVIHGHTPVNEPFVGDRRINIDTNAWATGRLTALRILADRTEFLTAVVSAS